MIFKLILLFSVILTDKFNPVQGSFDECTEHPQCINEGFTDGNCCPNDSGTYQSCCFQAECLVNPKCFAEGQTGYCCPDVNGIYKECCNDDPTPAPVIDAECSAYPACAARGLEGQCCPATDGTMLSMSYFICNIRGKTSFIYTLRAKHFFFHILFSSKPAVGLQWSQLLLRQHFLQRKFHRIIQRNFPHYQMLLVKQILFVQAWA